MSCQICGATVPKNDESLHDSHHAEIAYALTQLSERMQALAQEVDRGPEPVQPPAAPITADQEAVIRLKIAQELQTSMVDPRGRRRSPRIREEIQQAIATVVQGTQG